MGKAMRDKRRALIERQAVAAVAAAVGAPPVTVGQGQASPAVTVSESWQSELVDIQRRRAALRDRERSVVAAARGAGASWEQIGEVLGITRQTAHERFRPRGA